MTCLKPIEGDSPIHRLDPRTRVVVGFALAVIIATSSHPVGLISSIAFSAALVAAARIPWATALKRIIPLNLFMALLFALLPFTTPGQAVLEVGRLAATREGLVLASTIALKGNGIVLALMALLGTMEVVTLGHALHHLRVPDKLVHLFLFTVRYIEVLHHKEYQRLVRAMRVRCFEPRMNLHTYRSVGYLVGMLLVRSFDRSERILAAMKCRGFHGELYVIDQFAFGRRDGVFALLAAAAAVALLWVQWA